MSIPYVWLRVWPFSYPAKKPHICCQDYQNPIWKHTQDSKQIHTHTYIYTYKQHNNPNPNPNPKHKHKPENKNITQKKSHQIWSSNSLNPSIFNQQKNKEIEKDGLDYRLTLAISSHSFIELQRGCKSLLIRPLQSPTVGDCLQWVQFKKAVEE